ncbi:TrmH family RNA methyltransferase [Winogradskya consettensis]|uniref:RNA methyltransferase n=1 Tax=Winogradskya consettensis TaxID=113560 RepID=A0A919S868_9ACTN|nr:RNA methyltransferase [Actinoplanes consettensis]GIM66486.1 RNA methyltransferase [Actinoplanes consettensis]
MSPRLEWTSVIFTPRTPRIIAARKLQKRRDRDKAGQFLAEGPQAVRSALAAGVVLELFGTPEALNRYGDLAIEAPVVSPVDDDAIAALTETVQPQGLVAVCEQIDVPLAEALAKEPRLVAVAVEIRDPGNAGTILRTADAAGAGTVIFAGDAVDPYNGKCVRASAGSLFNVDVVRAPLAIVDELRDYGLQVLATTGTGETDLDSVELAKPTAWLFGSEAHGLGPELLKAADARVRVPIYGGAESLNLAAAAAVCLYASARAQRSVSPGDPRSVSPGDHHESAV